MSINFEEPSEDRNAPFASDGVILPSIAIHSVARPSFAAVRNSLRLEALTGWHVHTLVSSFSLCMRSMQ